MNRQTIQLNFLEINPQAFSFQVFRQAYAEMDEKREGIYSYRLPEQIVDSDFKNYWVSFDQLEGFDPFTCSQNTNIHLTLKFIHHSLVTTLVEKSIEFSLGKKFYDRHIDFIVKEHPTGKEKISLSSYFLRQENKFGFLIDFSFKVNDGEKLNKEILKLSLALSSDWKFRLA